MNIYPNIYLKNARQITIELLQKNKLKALILDVDNTLIDYDKKLSEETIQWAKNLKGQGTKMYLLSNTHDEEKIKTVANKLGLPYGNLATKPFKKGFVNAQNILNEKPENIAVVGDQLSTDILGGNRCKMFTILVEPIGQKDFWYTAWKRPFERYLVKRHLEKQKTKEKK